MRYLFTTVPGASHMLPMVPLAHAAMAAGHDVLVATSGPALRTAISAGLHAVAVDSGECERPYQEMSRRFNETSMSTDLPPAQVMDYAASVFAEVGALMADGVVNAAKTWGAQVILYPAPHVAGLLAARVVAVPAVLHGIGTRRPTFAPALGYLAPVSQRMGQTEVGEAEVELNLSPASLKIIHQDSPKEAEFAHTLAMRYAPYNGGAELPISLLRRGSRPRVAASLGSLVASYGEGALLREAIVGTADLGIELILTTGGAEVSALPSPLPAHVTLVDWMPMRALLATCDAIIHHGGMGTMYAAFDAGVPQLAIPQAKDDSYANSKVPVARGAGLMLDLPDAAAASIKLAVQDLLANTAYLKASREVAAEMKAMPAPGAVIGPLTKLLGTLT
jgi:glycosyltransferase